MGTRIARDDHVATAEHFIHALAPRLGPRGVIHVGAHEGEEVEVYRRHGVERVVLVEAQPERCATLLERFADDPGVIVIERAVADREGTAELHVHTSRSGNTEAASLLEMDRFDQIVPTMRTRGTIEVRTSPLDALLAESGVEPEPSDLLVLDVQGAELLALRGAERTLAKVGAVLTEVQLIDLYAGAATDSEVAAFLAERGFEPLETLHYELYDERGAFPAWGDALFVRAEPAQ